MKIFSSVTSIICSLLFATFSAHAQAVFPGKQTINKTEYLGLTLNQNVPEKYLKKYWESYLGRFGKVNDRRSVFNIEKASIPSISAAPVQVISEITSKKNQSQVFMAMNIDGSYLTNSNEEKYRIAESILRNFYDYAAGQEELRIADDIFTSAEKNYKRLIKDNEDTGREIEKTEKKLAELKEELIKKKAEADNSLADLQNKQRALEVVKNKVPTEK